MTSYEEFLKSKQLVVVPSGKTIELEDIHPALFDWQKLLVKWAVYKGCCALFADTGLGKTVMQVEWAHQIGGRGIIIAPLTVARQTVREADRLLGYTVEYVRHDDQIHDDQDIYITNYEMIHEFNVSQFDWVVLDESSILKNLMGKTKQLVTDMFRDTQYKLCATATPAPNDIKEIASHAEFLNIMSRGEMLSIFFKYTGQGTMKDGGWVLKSHAVDDFYRWLASWGMAIRYPSDIGFSDDGYILPSLTNELVEVDTQYTPDGMLPGFLIGGVSAIEAKKIRRKTLQERVAAIIELVNGSDEQWIIWCGLNDEADALENLIEGAVQVKGTQDADEKSDRIEAWQDGEYRVLVTKTKIAGMGMNFQNAHKMVFAGLDYSWESYYQAIRRCWRFGQEYPVDVFVVISNQERDVYEAVMKKDAKARTMMQKLTDESAQYSKIELEQATDEKFDYATDEAEGNDWVMMLGDSTERITELPDNSVDISVYSPPFSDLFVYSPTPRDVGNSKSMEQFFEHYGMIIRENLRVTKPGRLCCVHVSDLRALLGVEGYIGIKDFSGAVIKAYQDNGWTFWHRTTINKNPQAQAVRLKDHKLLFITLKKDSTKLSGGMPDYLLVFKKPGDNEVPVTPFDNGEVTNEDWIEWAHPVWNGISESDVLPVRQAKADDDEKHMCPLQLPVIERCVKLWSNPGETVFSPFAGIGSEGYEALRWGRRFIGIELKPEYYNVAKVNLENAERVNGKTLFDWADEQLEVAGGD
jgi:DNA modification methylase